MYGSEGRCQLRRMVTGQYAAKVLGFISAHTRPNWNYFRRLGCEAVRELESTGRKSTGICTGCTAADRHSIAELKVN